MRKSRKEAAETRRRIVSSAAAAFREHGIDSTGLADLMRAAGMTHGGFYKHFDSKEQLVNEAMSEAITEMASQFSSGTSRLAGEERLEAVVDRYLGSGHVQNRATGCPFAALGTELARSDSETRQIATDGYQRFVETIKGFIGDLPASEADRRALAISSLLIGTVITSRLVADKELSRDILSAGRHAVKAIAK